MKKSEFKNLVKPIIEECLKEMIIKEGMIAQIVSESIKGTLWTQSPNTTTERKQRNFSFNNTAKNEYSKVDKTKNQNTIRERKETATKLPDSPVSFEQRFPGLLAEDEDGVDLSRFSFFGNKTRGKG